MEKTIKDEIVETIDNQTIKYVNIFNDGSTVQDNKNFAKCLNEKSIKNSISIIEQRFLSAAKYYIRHSEEFDNLSMDIKLGLIFDREDVENGSLRRGAKPLDDIVRYVAKNIDSYLNEEKSKLMNYGEIYGDEMGYVNYNELVSCIQNQGLEFNGPETFEDFKTAILTGQIFDISVSASFKEGLEKPKELILK